MLNTRVPIAEKRVKWITLSAVIILLLITGLTILSEQHALSHKVVGTCSGYAGQPSHTYAHSKGDPLQAAEDCRHYIPKLSIKVKSRNYISLQKSRLEAVKEGVLNTGTNDFVPAQITFEGKSFTGVVRLKGDWAVYLQDDKAWSLRVLLSGNDEILGRRQFSIQKTEVRSHDVEFLYLQQLQQAGLMPVRMQLVNVEFNGKPWGLMELEDHFSPELVEAQKRKPTIIGRFDESDMWTHRAVNPDFGIYDSVYVNEFVPFDGAAIKTSTVLSEEELLVSSMMAAWQEGRLPFYQLADLEEFMRFIAITEAWGGWHAMRWHNLRFYLNPYTLKLEPVPFDNSIGLVDISKYVQLLYVAPNANAHSINMPPLNELFDSPRALPLLKSEVDKLKHELVDSDNFDALRAEQAFLKSNFDAQGLPTTVDLDLLKKNYEFLQSNFDQYVRKRDKPGPEPVPADPETRQYSSMLRVHAYTNGTITLSNKLPFEILVKDIYAISQFGLKQSLRDKVSVPARLPPTPIRGRPQVISLQVPDLDSKSIIEVTVENPHTGQVSVVRQERHLIYLDEKSYMAASPLLAPSTPAPAWLVQDANGWQIGAGSWSVDEPLIVPEGVALSIQAGAHLRMAPDAYILARGALNLLGEKSNPVTIEGQDGEHWRGIYVLNAPAESVWRHVVIRQLESFSHGEFSLTGAINFYRSNLSFEDVAIEQVDSEDTISIVGSRLAMDGLSISDITSDGLDINSSTGRIERSVFKHIGGDAIDTRGSQVEMSNVTFNSVHDKAISAGDASTVKMEGLDIDSVGIGIGVKDYSKATIDNARIRQVDLAAIMAYITKREYGGAYVEASNIEFDNSSDLAVSEFDNTIVVDKKVVKPRALNTSRLYFYGEGVMRK